MTKRALILASALAGIPASLGAFYLPGVAPKSYKTRENVSSCDLKVQCYHHGLLLSRHN